MYTMIRRGQIGLVGWVLLLCAANAGTAAVVIHRDRPPAMKSMVAAKTTPTVLYSHGDPTDMEQYLLELVNRAREDPSAECDLLINSGDDYTDSSIDSYSVDLDQLVLEFASYAPQPPLAFNALLITMARAHSEDMAANDFQGHESSTGEDLAARVDAVGYPYRLAGENVFAYAHTMLHAHAAFLIDWGVPDLGHRKNVLNLGTYTDFREAGFAVISENSPLTSVGPWVVTQNFGTASEVTVFITGVIYRDDNGNEFYDPGEGLADVEVRPDTGDYYAVTSTSGGYAIPVPAGSGAYNVTIYRTDLSKQSSAVDVGETNVKLDFILGASNSAQISGTVVDASGDGLSGVTVELDPIDASVVSDSLGAFVFSDLPAANYRVRATLEGYTFDPNDFIVSLSSGQVAQVVLTASENPPAGSQTGQEDNGEADTTDELDNSACCGAAGPLLLVMIVLGSAMLQGRAR